MANGDGKRCERDPTYVVSSPPLSPMQLTSWLTMSEGCKRWEYQAQVCLLLRCPV